MILVPYSDTAEPGDTHLLSRVVAIDNGIIEWLPRQGRARRKRTPERGAARGSPPKSTGLVVVSGEGAAQSASLL